MTSASCTIVRILWTLNGLGAMDGTHEEATDAGLTGLKHPSAGVRRAAVMVLPRTAETSDALLEHRLLEDDDAQVRMALTDGVSGPDSAGPERPGGGSTPNRPRGIVTS